jgi:hypothetical protein
MQTLSEQTQPISNRRRDNLTFWSSSPQIAAMKAIIIMMVAAVMTMIMITPTMMMTGAA